MAKSKEALLEEAKELGLELTDEEREDYKVLQVKVKEARVAAGGDEGDVDEESEEPLPPTETPEEKKDEPAPEPEEEKNEPAPKALTKEPKRITHQVTQDDLDARIGWQILGLEVGDIVELKEELDVIGVNTTGAEDGTKSGEVVDIVKQNGEYVRFYSKDVHGESFEKDAETFLSHNPNCSLVDGVKRITVEYNARKMPEGNWYRAQKVFFGPAFRENAIKFANELGTKATKWAH